MSLNSCSCVEYLTLIWHNVLFTWHCANPFGMLCKFIWHHDILFYLFGIVTWCFIYLTSLFILSHTLSGYYFIDTRMLFYFIDTSMLFYFRDTYILFYFTYACIYFISHISAYYFISHMPCI